MCDVPVPAYPAALTRHIETRYHARHLTANLSLPDGACGTWTDLYRGPEEFISDLTEHMRLENEVLFPQFEPPGQAHV